MYQTWLLSTLLTPGSSQVSRTLGDPPARDILQIGFRQSSQLSCGFRCVTKISGSGGPRAFPGLAAAPEPLSWSLRLGSSENDCGGRVPEPEPQRPLMGAPGRAGPMHRGTAPSDLGSGRGCRGGSWQRQPRFRKDVTLRGKKKSPSVSHEVANPG